MKPVINKNLSNKKNNSYNIFVNSYFNDTLKTGIKTQIFQTIFPYLWQHKTFTWPVKNIIHQIFIKYVIIIKKV